MELSTGAATLPCTVWPASVPGEVGGLTTEMGGGGGESRSTSPTPAKIVPLVALLMTSAALSFHWSRVDLSRVSQ